MYLFMLCGLQLPCGRGGCCLTLVLSLPSTSMSLSTPNELKVSSLQGSATISKM